MEKFDLQKKIALVLTILFLIISTIYIYKSKIFTDVNVSFDCFAEKGSYIEAHYRNSKNDPIKRHNIQKSGRYKNISFYIDINNYKNLYFYFGEKDQRVSINKLVVKNLLNSFTINGRRLFNILKKNQVTKGKIRKKGQIIEINTPFTMVSPILNKKIRQFAEEKMVYYLLLIPMTLLLYFFLSSLTYPNIYSLKKKDIFSIIFVFLLFIPILNSILIRSSVKKELAEKKIVKKEKIFRLSDLEGTSKRFTELYKKQFFHRADLIYVNNIVKTKIFGISPINKVILGKKGWLFYALENDVCNIIDYYRAVKPLSIKELEYWRSRLEKRYNWLKIRGIEYLFIVVPNKSSIYPELLPDNIKISGNINRFDQLIEYLIQVKSPVKILDMRREFLKKKSNFKIYRTSDSHWNHYGAYFGYKMIMKALESKSIKSFDTILNDYRIEKNNNYFGGDLAQMLSLGNEYREDITILEPIHRNQIITKQLRGLKKPFIEVSVKESKKGDIGTAIFVHDSFGYRLIPFMSQHFKRIIFIRDWQLEFYTDLIKKEKPVIVIEEMAERFFMNKVLSDPE